MTEWYKNWADVIVRHFMYLLSVGGKIEKLYTVISFPEAPGSQIYSHYCSSI